MSRSLSASRFPTRSPRRWTNAALGLALCTWLAIFVAQGTDARAAVSPGEAAASEETLSDIPVPLISVESDQPAPAPTHEQLMRRFRDALGRPLGTGVEERQLADGTLELPTQLGRFCARPLPAQSRSQVGGSTTLVAPCASF